LFLSDPAEIVLFMYVRYEAATPGPTGRHTGIFGLANGLARAGVLSDEDHAWWRASNDWIDGTYPDPGIADPSLFDKTINPTATCWFKLAAPSESILAKASGYLALLERYGVAWQERRTEDVGQVLYEDSIQIISDGRP
jgi:hypothetical protein